MEICEVINTKNINQVKSVPKEKHSKRLFKITTNHNAGNFIYSSQEKPITNTAVYFSGNNFVSTPRTVSQTFNRKFWACLSREYLHN